MTPPIKSMSKRSRKQKAALCKLKIRKLDDSGIGSVDQSDLEASLISSDSPNLSMDDAGIASCVDQSDLEASLISSDSKNVSMDDAGIARSVDQSDLEASLISSDCDNVSKRATYNVSGRRIISCHSLLEVSNRIALHGQECNIPKLRYHGEKRMGFESKLFLVCDCGWKTCFNSNSEFESLPINDAMALGSLNAPIAYNALTYLVTPMDIPSPSRKLFRDVQKKMGELVVQTAKKSMAQVGQNEWNAAVTSGNMISILDKDTNVMINIPFITVVVDGAWSKRSYGHSYNSNYGVGVIMSRLTGKVLSANIRQKVCYDCSRKTSTTTRTDHQCSKNWNKPSTAMEADSILEGFSNSVKDHGLIYNQFIGDGDSSVHAAVLNVYQNYGIQVRKIECLNHVVRNLNTHLRRIATGKPTGRCAQPITQTERSLHGMEDRFRRVGLAVHGAVDHYHKMGITKENSNHLADDICNIPYHVFGDHSKCKEYFCRRKGCEENLVPTMTTTGIWSHLTPVIQRVASKSSSLIEKENSNIVESFMSSVNRYLEGKRLNYGGRSLYQYRISSAVLSHNSSGFWSSYFLENCVGKTPNDLWQRCTQASANRRRKNKKNKKGRLIKFGFVNQGDKNYGPNPSAPDMSEDDRSAAVDRLAASLNVDYIQQLEIEEMTRQQQDNEIWYMERRSRITASNAGRITKMKSTTDNTATLKDLLGHNRRIDTKAMKYGREHEDIAIRTYENSKELPAGSVKKCGLFVSTETGIIGASPDGLVGDHGIVEIKCPFSIKDSTPETLVEKAGSPIRKCSTEPVTYELRKNHNYYYQVVTQLHVTGRQWCDFCIWTARGIMVIRVQTDQETLALWNRIKSASEKFWREDLAPELVDPRLERGFDEYHCPPSRQKARAAQRAKKVKPCTNELITI